MWLPPLQDTALLGSLRSRLWTELETKEGFQAKLVLDFVRPGNWICTFVFCLPVRNQTADDVLALILTLALLRAAVGKPIYLPEE